MNRIKPICIKFYCFYDLSAHLHNNKLYGSVSFFSQSTGQAQATDKDLFIRASSDRLIFL